MLSLAILCAFACCVVLKGVELDMKSSLRYSTCMTTFSARFLAGLCFAMFCFASKTAAQVFSFDGAEKLRINQDVGLSVVKSFSIQSTALLYPFEYDWTGGAPGYSGKLFLNMQQSPPTGGSIANVGPGSFIGTPGGEFTINKLTADSSSQAFTWDNS